jgi:sulfur carrier protein
MPTVTLNGEERTLPEGASVSDAILASGASESLRGVAVALDGEVVPRALWDGTELSDGGRVEVLRAVQGG